jgi:hypothetical protein
MCSRRAPNSSTSSRSVALLTAAPAARIVDDFCETHLWTLAVRYNKLHFLLWLHGRGFDFKGLVAQAAITAAENDYVALLNWLYSISEAAVWRQAFAGANVGSW